MIDVYACWKGCMVDILIILFGMWRLIVLCGLFGESDQNDLT